MMGGTGGGTIKLAQSCGQIHQSYLVNLLIANAGEKAAKEGARAGSSLPFGAREGGQPPKGGGEDAGKRAGRGRYRIEAAHDRGT